MQGHRHKRFREALAPMSTKVLTQEVAERPYKTVDALIFHGMNQVS